MSRVREKMKIKTNKRFDEQLPGFEQEMEYRFNQVVSLITGNSNLSINSEMEAVEIDLNTQDGMLLYTPETDEWITEIIFVVTEAFDDPVTDLKVKRFDTGAYIAETFIMDVVDTVSVKHIYIKFETPTDILLEFDKATSTQGKGVLFIKTYKP